MKNKVKNVDVLTDLIQGLGYRAKRDGGSILTKVNGLSVLVFENPGPSIQLYLGFKIGDQISFSTERANRYNSEKRFSKCYIEDGGLSFEQDFLFDPEARDAGAELEKIFDLWELVVSEAKDAIEEESVANRPDRPPEVTGE